MSTSDAVLSLSFLATATESFSLFGLGLHQGIEPSLFLALLFGPNTLGVQRLVFQLGVHAVRFVGVPI